MLKRYAQDDKNPYYANMLKFRQEFQKIVYDRAIRQGTYVEPMKDDIKSKTGLSQKGKD